MTSLLEQARAALKARQFGIASRHFLDHLRRHPDDAPARKEYRDMLRNLPPFAGRRDALIQPGASGVKHLKSVFKKREPAEVVERCEELLKENPFDLQVLFELGRAAREAKWHQTAVLAFDDAFVQGLRQPVVLRELGLAFYEGGRYEEAQKIFSRYDWKNEPAEIRKIIECDLPAMITATKFGAAPDVLAVEKNKGEALRAQKAAELVRDEATLRSKVASLEAVVNDPSNEASKRRTCACEIARLLRQFKKLDEAIAALEKARPLGGSDLEKFLTELRLEKADAAIATLEGPAKAAAVRERWALAASDYEALVRSAPTSAPELHLRLGEALHQLGTITDDPELIKQAIAQLQKDYADLRHKNLASILLGQCFVRLRLYPLAKKHFSEMLAGLKDRETREGRETVFRALYELGQVHLIAGEKVQALEVFSEILRRDVSWGDVADLVLKLNAEAPGPAGSPS
jgi:tetratricopeptide (TPR) repeat protein